MDAGSVAPLAHRSGTRLVVMLAVGIVVAIIVGSVGSWSYATVVGWAAASLLYTTWVWLVVGRMDAEQTQEHAGREDPTRRMADLLILVASFGSLAAVGVVLAEGHGSSHLRTGVLAGLAVLSVALSWLLIHTLFTLRYANLYYRGTPGGIGFNQDEDPQYSDFAYMSFSLGMTFQVSDTDLQNHEIRATAMRQSIVAFVFSSVILATTINLVVGLSG